MSNHGITLSNDYVITTPDPIEPTESLGTFIFTRMQQNAQRIAQIDARTGQQDTFEELLQRCVRTALHMKDKGVVREDIITLCTTNHLNAVVPYIATQFLGSKMSCIHPAYLPEETKSLLGLLRPKMIFSTPESIPRIESILKEISLDSKIVVFGQSKKYLQFGDFLKPHVEETGFEPVKIENLRDTALICCSSGTTGVPKGIEISHYAFIGQVLNSRNTDNPDLEYIESVISKVSFPMIAVCNSPMSWLSAGAVLLASINQRFCRLVCETIDGKEIWDLIQKYKPFMMILTLTEIVEMMANERTDVDTGNVLAVIASGSSLPKEMILKLSQVFKETNLLGGYGMTEVCGGILLFKQNDLVHRQLLKKPEKITSVGYPALGASYRVVDLETDRNLGPNQQGELRVKTKFLMNGYYKLDSSSTFDEDGWLKTGDIVYYDEDLCFYVVDRIKEAFKYREWYIPPSLLENELMKHPAVKFAVVVGIPCDEGQQPLGAVILNDGFKVTEQEIEKFVEERVPERLRLRAGVRFVKNVPLTVTGKVKRKEMKDMILNEKS